MPLRIAITGGGGFLGKALQPVLKEQFSGVEIIVVDRSNGYDITDLNSIKTRIPQLDHVIHLAAKTFVPQSYENPEAFYAVNTMGTANILELCRLQNARMVYLSSYVYGHPRSLPIKETDPLSAANPYGQSKLLGEMLCEAYARDFGVNVTSLRLFNLYGKGQGANFLIGKVLESAQAGVTIKLQDARPKRDYVYTKDVLSAIVRVLQQDQLKGFNAYNIASGNSYSIEELLGIVKKYYPSLSYTFSGEQRPNEILDTVADISKAKTELNWQPHYSLEDGIADIIGSNKIA